MENAGMSIWGGKETGGFGVSRNVSQWRYSFKIFSIGTYREEILYIVGKEMKFP